MEASVDQDEMVLITLLVPEFVVARTAYRQFLAARALITHLNEADTGAIDSVGGLPIHIQEPKGCQSQAISIRFLFR